MKACALCSSTYDDRVDFCFRDGAPLVAASPELAAAALAERGMARFAGGLDVPEPRSLDVTDAPEPSSLRAPAVPELSSPPPPPAVPEALTGEETLPPTETPSFERPAPPDPEQLSVDAPPDLPGPVAVPEPPEPEPEPEEDDEDDLEETLTAVRVPPASPSEHLTEPDTTDFFADQATDAEEPEEDDEDDIYGGIPYAETPKKQDKLPIILAGVSLLLVGGAIFAFSGGGGDSGSMDGEPVEQVARPEPAKPPVRPPPATPKPEPTPVAVELEVEPDAEPASASAAETAPEPVPEVSSGGNGIGSADGLSERERRRQEKREARQRDEAERAAADQARTDEQAKQEAKRREAERRDAERKEAKRREAEAEAARSSGSQPVAVAEPSGASNPWGQVDEATEGTLRVNTTPRGASVWIDDAPKGKAPISTKLPFGSHKVRVAMDGYKDKTMVIDLQSESRDLAFNLPQDVRSGPVIIYGSLGAKVYLGDKLLGPIPVSTTLQEGTYTFTVVQEGTFYKVAKTISFENVQGTLPITLTAQ